MSYRATVVEKVQQRISAREEPFLLCYLRGVGFAACWRDYEVIWPDLHRSCDAFRTGDEEGARIMLDIVQADKVGPDGQPYRHIVGIEDPNQQLLC